MLPMKSHSSIYFWPPNQHFACTQMLERHMKLFFMQIICLIEFLSILLFVSCDWNIKFHSYRFAYESLILWMKSGRVIIHIRLILACEALFTFDGNVRFNVDRRYWGTFSRKLFSIDCSSDLFASFQELLLSM